MSIRSILKEKQITQQELAKNLKVTQSAVSLWVNNKCLPKTSRLEDIAKYCKCSINDLIKKEEE